MTADLTEVELRLFRDLAWFAPDTELLGQMTRPVSIASWHAMRLMGLTLFDGRDPAEPESEAALRREEAEIGVFLWIHTAEIETIERAIWDGTWREILDSFLEGGEAPPSEAVIGTFRLMRERLLATLAASRIRVRPRPKPEHAEPVPSDVAPPSLLAWRLSRVMRETGLPLVEVKWRLPLAQFWQLFHCAEWQDGQWTVPDPDGQGGAGPEVSAFEGFDLPEEIDGGPRET